MLTYASTVNPVAWANLWKCPPPIDQDQWWCGDNTSEVCQKEGLFSYPVGALGKIAGAEEVVQTADISGSAIPTQTSSQTSTGTRSPTATVTASSGSDSDKVSKSVPIGVGLGVGLPLALVSCVFATLWLRERKQRRQAEEKARAAERVPSYYTADPKVASHPNPYPQQPQQLGGSNVYEMSTEPPPPEMESPSGHKSDPLKSYPRP